MAKTLDQVARETLGSQVLTIAMLQELVAELQAENAALKAKDAPAPEGGT